VSALPLAGRRVLVTRALQQAGKLSDGLRALGAEPVEVPVLEIVPPESYAPLDEAIQHLDRYDWLILTSSNTLQAVGTRSARYGVNAANAEGLKVAAVGSATAEAAQQLGFQVAVVPEAYVAESLVSALGDLVRGKRLLLPRAAVARDVIPDALRAAGAEVDVVEAYRNVMPEAAPEQLRQAVAGGLDAATFTSSSSVTHLAEAARAAGIAWPLTGVPAVSIGPITSKTLCDLGWPPIAEADPSDISGLIAAVVRVLTPSNSEDILTARLRLTPATQELLRLELEDAPAFAALLGASLPEDWPPGEYDRNAIQFFLEKTIEGGKDAVGWYGWYAILQGEEPAALIGCGGYLGPPDDDGCVEIGYSISERWRGQGLAKELVQALMNRAWTLGARKIMAHTTEANPASIAVLRRCGFQRAISPEKEQLQFEIVRSTL
jgi:uroporphyrinogen-III synthase/uroporphyrinogen III methyltransferase/synthase